MRRSPEGSSRSESAISVANKGRLLRLVTGGEVALPGPGSVARRAPDLRVDATMANLMLRSRWCAVVRVRHANGGDVPLHAGLVEILRDSLDGREPATGFGPDFVEVNFCVLDGGVESLADAQVVGDYLASVVDPSGERLPEVTLRQFDTSDIDHLLPEDQRTLR